MVDYVWRSNLGESTKLMTDWLTRSSEVDERCSTLVRRLASPSADEHEWGPLFSCSGWIDDGHKVVSHQSVYHVLFNNSTSSSPIHQPIEIYSVIAALVKASSP